MLYSLKKQTGHERPKDKSTNKIKKLWDNTHPLSPHPYHDMNQPPPTYPVHPMIHNNNTMDTEFQVQMRQSNKCGSVRNDEIFNLHLGSGAGAWVSIPCLLQLQLILQPFINQTMKQSDIHFIQFKYYYFSFQNYSLYI